MLNQLQVFEIEEINMISEADHLVNGDEASRFVIENLEQVNWAFRKIKAYLDKKREIDDLANKELQRIKLWQESETKSIQDSIAYFECLLMEYGVKQREVDHKFKASTPYGKITFRKQQDKWEYDESIAIQALKEMGQVQFIRIKEELDKANLKKAVSVANGKAVTEHGEIIEGITITEQPEKIDIKVVE